MNLSYLKTHVSKAEVISVVQTFVAVAVVDGAASWNAILAGDWSKAAWLALAIALGRSVLKAVYMVVTTPPEITPPIAPSAPPIAPVA
jgi:hypothetical protein